MYRIGNEEIEAVANVIRSGSLFKTMGTVTSDCEALLKQIFNVDFAILMTSGKAAIISALTSLGIGPGDEVIVPGYTYIATAIAVTAVGAIPVIAEVDETMTIDVDDVRRKTNRHTKAIIPVNIQGFPSNLAELCALGIPIVEDSCQADGGGYKGRRLGSIGEAGTLSFNQFKILTTGEGGAFLTNDRRLFERALIFHDSSAIAYFGNQLSGVKEPQFCGNEYRTNNITAAILTEQLKKLDRLLYDLRSNKRKLQKRLEPEFAFAPSHDPEGDCGTTLAFRFSSEAKARSFAEKSGGTVPIDTGKHVYSNWTPVLEKRGALNPAMDPYKMPVNQNLNHNYSIDMCPRTLDYLSRTVYIMINPDWTDNEVENKAAILKDFRT